MEASEREALLQRIAHLRAEIAATTTEIESSSVDIYEPRIRDLEEELEDTQRAVLDIRRSIATSSPRRMWSALWIAVGIVVIFIVLGSR